MFSRKPAAANPRPASGSTSMRGSTFSVLGADTAIKGNVSASADLHIDGKVEGDVTCSALVQGETGEIVGGVKAEIEQGAQVDGRFAPRQVGQPEDSPAEAVEKLLTLAS